MRGVPHMPSRLALYLLLSKAPENTRKTRTRLAL